MGGQVQGSLTTKTQRSQRGEEFLQNDGQQNDFFNSLKREVGNDFAKTGESFDRTMDNKTILNNQQPATSN